MITINTISLAKYEKRRLLKYFIFLHKKILINKCIHLGYKKTIIQIEKFEFLKIEKNNARNLCNLLSEKELSSINRNSNLFKILKYLKRFDKSN